MDNAKKLNQLETKMDDIALFYDTETTGLPLFREPSDDPRQPHLVQLGACLVDLATGEVLQSIDVMIAPDGWTIPDEVAKIHGITTEKATAYGVPEKLALDMLLNMWERGGVPRTRIGHNESFDARIIRIACKRHHDEEIADLWKAGPAKCTATLATPIVNLPPTDRMLAAGRKHAKTPNLGEAFKFFMEKELDGAHNAMVDVLACKDVFFKMRAIGHC